MRPDYILEQAVEAIEAMEVEGSPDSNSCLTPAKTVTQKKASIDYFENQFIKDAAIIERQ